MSAYIILLGAPGSGKGTQSKILSQKLDIPIVSMGDLIRKEVSNQSEIGIKAQSYMAKGALVPDEVIVDMFKKNVTEVMLDKGFIADGFPRNKSQSEAIDTVVSKGSKKKIVISIDVSLESIKGRLLGREICSKCNAIYHKKSKPPKKVGQCDECQSPLKVRADDTESVIQNRYEVYEKEMTPVLDHFGNEVIHLGGERHPDDVLEDILKYINK